MYTIHFPSGDTCGNQLLKSSLVICVCSLPSAFMRHTCISPLPLAASGDHYTIFRVETTRPDVALATLVYVARDPKTSALRVIGIYRL